MAQVRFFERIGSAIDRVVSPLVGRLSSTLSKHELSRMWNELVTDGGSGLADLLQKLAAETSDYADRVTPTALREASSSVKTKIGGGLAGTILGWILGGGSIGVVGLGMAVGIPVVVVTGILGMLVADYGYNGLLPLARQWRATFDRAASIRGITHETSDGSTNSFFLNGTREHRAFLLHLLDSARSCLTIRSAFISSYAVNDKFIEKLRGALARGVTVTIEYGYHFPGAGNDEDYAGRERAVERLRGLQREASDIGWGALRLTKTLTHIKEIAVDDHQLAIGGFNWLSNASQSQKANAEKSIVVYHEQFARDVRMAAQEAADQFGSGRSA